MCVLASGVRVIDVSSPAQENKSTNHHCHSACMGGSTCRQRFLLGLVAVLSRVIVLSKVLCGQE